MSEDLVPKPPSILDTGRRIMASQLASIPAGRKGAMVAYVDSQGTIRWAVATKLGEHWTFAAEVEKRLREDPTAFVGIEASW